MNKLYSNSRVFNIRLTHNYIRKEYNDIPNKKNTVISRKQNSMTMATIRGAKLGKFQGDR